MLNNFGFWGLGLLGGSASRSLRGIRSDAYIKAFVRSKSEYCEALSDGVLNELCEAGNADLSGLDLLVVSVPVATSLSVISEIINNPTLPEHCLVIDVGSVKKDIIEMIEKSDKASRFIGCHPMAGSEKSGYGHSRPDLYFDAPVIITPNRFNEKSDLETVESFWTELGARVIYLDAEQHDAVMARSSHLPHLAAVALTLSVTDYFDKNKSIDISNFIGGGYKDTTRIAAGSVEMWGDICLHNREFIITAIDEYIETLSNVKNAVSALPANGTLINNILTSAKTKREGLK